MKMKSRKFLLFMPVGTGRSCRTLASRQWALEREAAEAEAGAVGEIRSWVEAGCLAGTFEVTMRRKVSYISLRVLYAKRLPA